MGMCGGRIQELITGNCVLVGVNKYTMLCVRIMVTFQINIKTEMAFSSSQKLRQHRQGSKVLIVSTRHRIYPSLV